MPTSQIQDSGFESMNLLPSVARTIEGLGYMAPTPIQSLTIPSLLEGRDVLGQAQTGTGKTAAYALPLLSRIDLAGPGPQALVLAPTRELAIQVGKSFASYSKGMKGFRVLTIYGGQDYGIQNRGLEAGPHVVVGTPGRIMDHMRRGTLKLKTVSTLVLDEADEMLRMGFIDDVEWILERTPDERQVVLFSATMPTPIKRIAKKHLKDPAEMTIEERTTAATTIRQRYLEVGARDKTEALARILEVEPHEGVLVFARTKTGTVELADQLVRRGLDASALNGDMPQRQRELTVDRLKDGRLDILVATDVAARGLDVERISHVINYDAPTDVESYVHRIGRTGRAGKAGEAILFLTGGERRILKLIGRVTRQTLDRMPIPSVEKINENRVERFGDRITATLEGGDAGAFRGILDRYIEATGAAPLDVAAALAHLMQGGSPMFLDQEIEAPRPPGRERANSSRPRVAPKPGKAPRAPRRMDRYTLHVGRTHGVRPGNIAGAIANETGLDNSLIGRIEIFEGHSTVELPEGMPREVYLHLKKVRVCRRPLKISRLGAAPRKGHHRA